MTLDEAIVELGKLAEDRGSVMAHKGAPKGFVRAPGDPIKAVRFSPESFAGFFAGDFFVVSDAGEVSHIEGPSASHMFLAFCPKTGDALAMKIP